MLAPAGLPAVIQVSVTDLEQARMMSSTDHRA
jgi:hypothetical protein